MNWGCVSGDICEVQVDAVVNAANEVYHDTLKWWAEWDRNRRKKDGKGRTVRVR